MALSEKNSVIAGLKSARREGRRASLSGADLSGQRFNRLTVIERAGSTPNSKRLWRCACDCGGMTIAPTGHLRSGNTQSCGCIAREQLSERNYRHGYAGEKKLPEYIVWEGMNARCHNPHATNYRYYGAKGVRVCDLWRQSFSAFLDYVGFRPSDAHSIDRIDPFGDYEPGNVRWATRSEQTANRRTNHLAARWAPKEDQAS